MLRHGSPLITNPVGSVADMLYVRMIFRAQLVNPIDRLLLSVKECARALGISRANCKAPIDSLLDEIMPLASHTIYRLLRFLLAFWLWHFSAASPCLRQADGDCLLAALDLLAGPA
jgi:hypothetical protein